MKRNVRIEDDLMMTSCHTLSTPDLPRDYVMRNQSSSRTHLHLHHQSEVLFIIPFPLDTTLSPSRFPVCLGGGGILLSKGVEGGGELGSGTASVEPLLCRKY